eukprot:TRINITY_DN40170_c0_g1_i1.p1 TRINITY_DN40170_c0_g1~~TRINITY_DN40170_c0_g1_i1.p1  ORF type:complete len:212 (-),score=55.76 TRINITY_DN40170_c0_g1_i1:137-772(-)
MSAPMFGHKDLQDLLCRHASVQQAFVVVLPHPSGEGEILVAWALAKDGHALTTSELRRHCRAAAVPEWQMPSAFNVVKSGQGPDIRSLQERNQLHLSLVKALLQQLPEQEICSQPRKLSALDEELLSQVLSTVDQGRHESLSPEQWLAVMLSGKELEQLESAKRAEAQMDRTSFENWLRARIQTARADERAAWLLQAGCACALQRNNFSRL